MSEHRATISWFKNRESFAYEDYDRNHQWQIAGHTIAASAAPQFRGDASKVDPEAAFVAALSSCHMLTFLAICSRQGLVVESYQDEALGYLEKDDTGSLVLSRVRLRPTIVFAQASPSKVQLAALHERSHQECFLANSVRTVICVEG